MLIQARQAAVGHVAWPGTRLGDSAGCVGGRLVRRCPFIYRHIHWLLFDERGAPVGVLRGDGGRTGLVVLWLMLLGVSAALVGCLGVLLLRESRAGLHQLGLKALHIRLLVLLDGLGTCLGPRASDSLIGPHLRTEKCIGRVVIVAVRQCSEIGVVAIDWPIRRWLVIGREASPCIEGRVGVDVVGVRLCRVAFHRAFKGLILNDGLHLLFHNCCECQKHKSTSDYQKGALLIF